ncbi:8141_t:CDS:1 [Diversispora eburnea]|uniref:8141_t:CDS:1 n=1 Tax=Diversispora eburnea TaxID=1213867 RepID=A0A9N8ZPW4_9GLOM|nr:8141_t:CDS:1 [Diversispora eburnea]
MSYCIDKGKNPQILAPSIQYLKQNKNIEFIFEPDSDYFIKKLNGGTENILKGTLRLKYDKPVQVKYVNLNLRCTEKSSSYESQGRSNILLTGTQIVIDKIEKIWEAKSESTILSLDIPFAFSLPEEIPSVIITKYGQVNYVLKAVVCIQKHFVSTSQIVEISYPLKKLIMDTNTSYYKLRGESKSGLEYSFDLPPNKIFNIGTWVPILMRIQHIIPHSNLDRLEISLRTSMDFRFDKPRSTTRQINEKLISIMISHQDIVQIQPTNQYHGDFATYIDLTIPKSIQPSYSGRVISITHYFCVNFYFLDSEKDFSVEEPVIIANIDDEPSMSPTPPQIGTPILYNNHSSQISHMNISHLSQFSQHFGNNSINNSYYHPKEEYYPSPQTSGNHNVEDSDDIRVAPP